MQTDVWLTETSNEDTCPLCSKPLKRGAQTCFTCGFSRNSPTVWIDPTVHGYQHVMPQYTMDQLTPDPQAASPVWQYDSPHFEAAGSLPMLSLFLPETPTQPQPPVPNKLTTRRLPRVDEIDTQPPQMSPARDIDQFDTQPPKHKHEQRALILASPTAPMAAVEKESRSWTAGTALGSPSAQLIMRPSRRHHLRRVSSFHPLDQARWWLLRPGRIEFILWLGGTVLLIGVTCLLLFVCALSFQWIAPFAPASPLASSAGNNTQRHTVSPGGAGPFIMLENTGSLVPGRSFQLRGQGFKPASKVTFYLDDKLSLLNQGHQTAWTQVDAHGTFDSTLWLSTGAGWAPGPHMLIARDATDGQSAIVPVQLAASSSGGGTVASVSPTPTTGSPSGNTSTGTGNPTPTPQGPQSTPVSRPPVTVTPTLPPVTPTPSPTHAPPPTVTPTATTSPTVTPTPASSPASGTPTPGVSPTSSSTGLGNALNDSGVPPVASRLGSVSPLVWLMLACYLLSMLSLGAAGIIHRRHRKMIL